MSLRTPSYGYVLALRKSRVLHKLAECVAQLHERKQGTSFLGWILYRQYEARTGSSIIEFGEEYDEFIHLIDKRLAVLCSRMEKVENMQ